MVLFFSRKPRREEILQLLDGAKHLVGTSQHPSTDFSRRKRGHQVHRNSLAMRDGQFGGGAPILRERIPVTDDVVGVVFDDVQIERDNFSHYAAETLDVRGLPLAEMRGFLFGEVFPFIFARIVHAVAKLLAQIRRKFAAPEPAAVFCILDRTTKIREHLGWAGGTLT